ncbi:Hypothetical protein NTJ_02482 [Nesidiocoris tenuis]|uniref:Kazal-like domain-containing protein n=1 Tax=Nesidiocoris tenuis TaxID=355587 RepID=A0ABN7ABP2_9HEMI|nr:Hypothetical protein NTJ_02482 [Nesidiocoris tenuis]
MILRSIVICIFVVIVLVNSSQPKCNCRCPKIADVCGRNVKTKQLDTFGSDCHMLCYACTHDESWVLVNKGPCKKSKRSIISSPSEASGLFRLFRGRLSGIVE